jgi:hypothetical protein
MKGQKPKLKRLSDDTVPGQVINKPGGGGVGEPPNFKFADPRYVITIFGPAEPSGGTDIGYFFDSRDSRYVVHAALVNGAHLTGRRIRVIRTGPPVIEYLPDLAAGDGSTFPVRCYQVKTINGF